MRIKLIFLFLAVVLHLFLFLVMPQVFKMPERRTVTVVSIEPVERTVPKVVTAPEKPASRMESAKSAAAEQKPAQPKPPQEKPKPAPKPAEPKPKPADPKPAEPSTKPVEPKPEPVPRSAEPKPEEPKPVEVPATPAEQLPEKGEETFSKPEEKSPIIADEHMNTDSSGARPASPAEEDWAEAAAAPAPPVKEELDGKVDIHTVPTFVGDRMQYSLSFTGKGRKFISSPMLGDFKLSNNTTVTVLFKIDKNGTTYDIEVPPVPGDIDLMLRDFVRKMRFSAVLYNESDSAEIKITLKVR